MIIIEGPGKIIQVILDTDKSRLDLLIYLVIQEVQKLWEKE